MNRTFRTICALTLLLCMAAPAALAEREPLPELLVFRQRSVEDTKSRRKLKTNRAYPETANEAVNREIAAIVDRLGAEADQRVPKRIKETCVADTGATVRVTGTKTASFLVLSHVAADHEQIWSAFETAVYDLESGKRLTLDDVFAASADAALGEAVREQLTAYFPALQPDAETLDGLCASVRETPFTLSPAYLEFHYQASVLYPGKTTLMHVRIPYRLLTGYMTDYGLQELDNSRYLLAAMTFDDGPGRGVTAGVLETLREWCAVGTFFNCGRPMRSAHDYVAWEHDAGHAVQSHTFTHTDRQTNKEVMFTEKERFAAEQTEIIGIPPAYMRAPGGNDKLYARYEIGMPIVRWTTLSGDAGSGKIDYVGNMMHTLKETSIILMHNTKWPSVRGAGSILERLNKLGYMCVTVDELFEIRGMPMQDNTVYFGDEADQRE